jgi:hypothetical protein
LFGGTLRHRSSGGGATSFDPSFYPTEWTWNMGMSPECTALHVDVADGGCTTTLPTSTCIVGRNIDCRAP